MEIKVSWQEMGNASREPLFRSKVMKVTVKHAAVPCASPSRPMCGMLGPSLCSTQPNALPTAAARMASTCFLQSSHVLHFQGGVPRLFAGRETCPGRLQGRRATLGSPGATTHQGNDGGTSSRTGHNEQVVGHVELGKNRALT